MIRLIHGDSLEVLPTLKPGSVHSIVTDPPYGLAQDDWDEYTPAELQDFTKAWATAARPVIRPGGHFAVFTTPRLSHRVAQGLEAAGLEIRDMLAWLYNTGVPKATSCGQEPTPEICGSGNNPDLIDRSATPEELVFRAWLEKSSINREAAVAYLGKPYDRFWSGEVQVTNTVARWKPAYWARCSNIPTPSVWEVLKTFAAPGAPQPPEEIEKLCRRKRPAAGKSLKGTIKFRRETPLHQTEEYQNTKWSGWATGLRPAMEIVVLARRPLSQNSITRNQWAEGVGALNIEECRIEGRWPGTVIADDNLPAELDGLRAAVIPKIKPPEPGHQHPTAKPPDVMQWLQTLITPPDGITLDPFCGAGASAVAARRGGFHCIGIDQAAECIELAHERVEHAETLFDQGVPVRVEGLEPPGADWELGKVFPELRVKLARELRGMERG